MKQRLQQSLNIIKSLPFTAKTEHNMEEFYMVNLVFEDNWLLVMSLYKREPSNCSYSIYKSRTLIEANYTSVKSAIQRFKELTGIKIKEI